MWLDLLKTQHKSGMKVTDWCDLNGISTKTYYYHHAKLHKLMLAGAKPDPMAVQVPAATPCESPPTVGQAQNNAPAGSSLAEVPAELVRAAEDPAPDDVALRITKGQAVIEVSNNASESILSLLKEVLIHA